MQVNLILKFKFYDRNITDKHLKNIVDFTETTCIKNYKGENYNVNISSLGIEYYYYNVPYDRMPDLYSDVQKFDGLVSIIINDIVSRK